MIRVESVDVVDVEADVYDIEVDVDHSFIVAGVVVHNCAACGAMDGKRWKVTDTFRRPPLHPNDRCVMVPVVDWEGLGIEPPDAGQRASMDGPVSSQTHYEQWLRGRSAAFQDEVLGPGRGRLFRKGTTLADMVRRDGSILTLDELEAA